MNTPHPTNTLLTDAETIEMWRQNAADLSASVTREIALNRKLRAEIRVLQHRLRDANRGAERNAWALYEMARGKVELVPGECCEGKDKQP